MPTTAVMERGARGRGRRTQDDGHGSRGIALMSVLYGKTIGFRARE